MRVNTYLLFNGNCEVAFKFYEQTLGGKITFMMTHAEMPGPEQPPAEWKDKILHASLMVGDFALMGSDAPPAHYEKPQGFSVSLDVKEQAEAERIFSALSAGGIVKMPLQKTFWASRFGMLVDKFSIPWMVNCA